MKQRIEVECPNCGALNRIEEKEVYGLVSCWSCGYDFEYDKNGNSGYLIGEDKEDK